ncbi:MAG: hypothetical protein WCJ84_01090 [Candidatus Peregrinibacteria bacterium]
MSDTNAFQTAAPSMPAPQKEWSMPEPQRNPSEASSSLFPIIMGVIILCIGAGALYYSTTVRNNLKASVVIDPLSALVGTLTTPTPASPVASPTATAVPTANPLTNLLGASLTTATASATPTPLVTPTPLPSATPTIAPAVASQSTTPVTTSGSVNAYEPPKPPVSDRGQLKDPLYGVPNPN